MIKQTVPDLSRDTFAYLQGGHDPKRELSEALCKQMQLLERKKKGGFGGRAPPSEQKQRDDVRILHEAYQFLSKRYV